MENLNIFLVVFGVIQCILADDLQTRIIGGTPATIEEFPSVAFLEFEPGRGCGATILNKNTILTAAHCVAESSKNYTVYVGSDKVNELLKQPGYPVRSIKIHPEYDYLIHLNDVAVLRIDPLQPGKWKPVELPKPNQEPIGENIVAVGWGATSLYDIGNPPPQHNQLEKVHLPIQHDCHEFIGPWIYESEIICTGTVDKQACKGDSGGPLFIDGVQHGIANRGSEEGKHVCTARTLFMKVSGYLDWILQAAKELS